MKRLYIILLGLLLLASLQGQILRYSNYTVPEPPAPGDTLGTEMISNGTFADGTDWTAGAGWTITGGVAAYNNTNESTISQADGDMLSSLENGATYRCTFTLNTAVRGSLQLKSFEAVVNVTGQLEFDGNGERVVRFIYNTSSGGGIDILGYNSISSFTIDNLSLKKVL